VRWRPRRRRAALTPATPAADDPYAAYLDWKASGRPELRAADLRYGDPIALPPAADDVREDDIVIRPRSS